MIPERMRGVALTGHGGPDKLEWREDLPTPRPGPGEVLTRVLAAGVNNTDINTRIGWYNAAVTGATGEGGGAAAAGGWSGALAFPRIQGADLCGEVVALGAGVTDIRIGARVTCPTNQPNPAPGEPKRCVAIGSEYDGAFAEYCVVPARQLYDVTASPLSDVEIAAAPCAHGTAMNLIDRAGLKAGERLIVTGASGGVGLATVQLAAHLGARVTGVSGAAKADAVRAAGAAEVIGRDARPEAGAFDVAIDLVGGPGFPALLDALGPGGRYAVSGAIAGPIVSADLRAIYLRDLTLFGCTYTAPEVFARLVGLLNEGAVRPLVSAVYPMREIRIAQEVFMSKTLPGKIVLTPPGAGA